MRKASTDVIIGALKILANDIHSPDDVPQLALREAWERLEELVDEVKTIEARAVKEERERVEREYDILEFHLRSFREFDCEKQYILDRLENVLKQQRELLKQKEL